MKLGQVYETRLISKTSGHSAHLIVVPGRCYQPSEGASPATFSADQTLTSLGFAKIAPVLQHRLATGLALNSVAKRDGWLNGSIS